MALSESSFILKNDDTLWGCGWNDKGQLGLGYTSSNMPIFMQIMANKYEIKSVYCGYNYTFILKNDGTLWGCGDNSYGQLGLGDSKNRLTFTQITANTDDIKFVYCGYHHTFILKNDGTLWGCGNNSNGQLGLGDTTNRSIFTQIITNANDIKSIYYGVSHMLILKNDDTLWGCGLNSSGQLGLGDSASDKIMTLTQITNNVDNVKSAYCSWCHTFILKNDGTLWGCGWNDKSQLGLRDTNNRSTFTQITANANNIKCFANNYDVPAIKFYDTQIGYIETLDTNNFRNIPINSVEKLKSLCVKLSDTHLNCLISFDKKQTWKAFDGTNWNVISDISPENIIVNGMEVNNLNKLDKNKLISGGFTGDLDFKIAMKTNDTSKTPSITKIYIEYK